MSLTASSFMHIDMQKLGNVFADPQTAFIDFVLDHYINQGVEELSQEKLKGLLELKCHSVHDATLLLGNPSEIRQLFVGFQKHLYISQSIILNCFIPML